MKINNPTKDNFTSFQLILRWAQSVFKATQHGLGIAQPAGTQDSAGRFNSFNQDNLDCVLIYVGALGSGAAIVWAASNVGQAINHGLLRQPIGFFPVFKNKACDVYCTVTPTTNSITLAVTDDTATTIIAVF